MYYRSLNPRQRSQVFTTSIDGDRQLVYETDEILLEAPNWTLDGRSLLLNGGGVLWRLDLGSGDLSQVDFDGLPEINNDHVLAPDGDSIYLSACDWQIYRAPVGGGRAERVTRGPDSLLHFLHGVSPDGESLVFTGLELGVEGRDNRANVFTVPSRGGEIVRLTDTDAPADGAEYSPDGEWVYFNTEQFSRVHGHAQIARVRADGSGLEQLTFDDRVNWFPHWSPDGRLAVYLSFPPGTTGHPVDRIVQLRVVHDGEWARSRTVAELLGGQGTINVNSWSPDSDRFAYVAYPVG